MTLVLNEAALDIATKALVEIGPNPTSKAMAWAAIQAYLAASPSLPLEGAGEPTKPLQRYTAWPEIGPFDAYYVRLEEDPEGRLVLHDDLATLLASQAAELDRVTKERDEAVRVARELTKALTRLTPNGSEFFSRNSILDDYFADIEACVKIIRERFESGHDAKLALATERAAHDAAVRALAEATGHIDRLLEQVDWALRTGLLAKELVPAFKSGAATKFAREWRDVLRARSQGGGE